MSSARSPRRWRRSSSPTASGSTSSALGEHHRPDYAVSAPAVALAYAAARTKRIRLSSAVTVLSSDDPVRVYQQFATLDLLSGGRAEIMAGRGSFIESFPLFGYDLDDYDELFAEKLDLLLAIRASERVTWAGRLRAPLEGPRRLSARAAGPAAGVDRGRRHAAIGRARRGAGFAARSRDHRRRAGALRADRRSLSRGRRARRPRSGPPGAGDQRPRLPRRHGGRSDRRLLRALRRDDVAHRPRARLAAADARPVRRRPRAERPPHGRDAGGGDRQDPRPARAVRPPALL